METNWILKALERYHGVFPRGALREAMAHREEITPALLDILRDAQGSVQRMLEQEDYLAPLYAMYLLSYFREKAAYPLIVDFFSIPGEVTLDVTGDLVTEDLGRMLASVCDGDMALMRRLAENEQANEYVRNAALAGMVTLAACGLKPREEILAHFQDLFRTLPRETHPIWGYLVDCSAQLYGDALLADIEQAFREELVPEDYADLDWVHEYFARGKDEVLAETKASHHRTLIADPIQEMGSWASFQTPPRPEGMPAKVGRNQPCPCGSGRKYKHCCGSRR